VRCGGIALLVGETGRLRKEVKGERRLQKGVKLGAFKATWWKEIGTGGRFDLWMCLAAIDGGSKGMV
jgi:hypothetical protein